MNAARFTAGDPVNFSFVGVRGWRHEVPAVVIAAWLTTARIEMIYCGQLTTRLVPTEALSVRLMRCAELDLTNHHHEELTS